MPCARHASCPTPACVAFTEATVELPRGGVVGLGEKQRPVTRWQFSCCARRMRL